jgi:WD40 repeat protein
MLTLLSKRIILALATLFCLTSAARPQNSGENAAALLAKLACPDRVKDVAFSPDGKLLAAGYGWNDQGGARIWNVADHAIVATLTIGKGEEANIERVAFSPDGRLFATANWNGDVMLWTVGSWSSHKVVVANRGSSKSLTFSPDSTKIAFSSEDAAIIYDLRSGNTTVLATRTNERNSFISIAFSPDGKSVILFRDDALQMWDIESSLSRPGNHQALVFSVRFQQTVTT